MLVCMAYVPGTYLALLLLDRGLGFGTVVRRLVDELEISTDEALCATLAAMAERNDLEKSLA